MEVTVRSVLGHIQKEVTNKFFVENVTSVEALCRMVVTDRTAVLIRQDGKELSVVNNGSIYTEVFNQKQLLVDWCNLLTDEFPEGGEYAKSGI